MEYIGSGDYPIAIFCDPAFDCVDPILLLTILKNQGIGGVALKWVFLIFVSFHTFKSNKKHEIRSISMNVKSRLSQRSILGPILYILCINFSLYIRNVSLLLMLMISLHIISCLDKNSLQNLLKKIVNIFNSHNMFFNTNKPKILPLHNYDKMSQI